MVVYVLEPIHERALKVLREEFTVVTWREVGAAAWHEWADGVIVRAQRITREDLARARRLKVIGKHGVGLDNIHLEAAAARGVRVVNTPQANLEAVAEFTLGLVLAVVRKISLADRLLRENRLPPQPELIGTELQGKALGVVGLGAIGRRVAELFRSAFAMEVLGYDPYLPEKEWAASGVRRVEELHTLLPQVDVISLHLPLTAETRGLIGARELKAMRPTAFLVNTSRGGIVDEEALRVALEAGGPPAGAAADVFEVEPLPADHPLLLSHRFVATPHLGALTEESMLRMGLTVVQQVKEELAGRVSPFRVT